MNPYSPSRAVERKLTPSLEPAAAPAPELNPEPGAPRPNAGPFLAAGENVEDFRALTASLLDHYHPATNHEYSLVEDLACERWFLLRRQRAFEAVEAHLFARQPDPAAWSDADYKRLGQAERHRTQAERAFRRALESVQAFRRERVATYRWQALYDMAVRRLEFAKKKHEHNAAGRAKRMDVAA